MPTEAVSLRRGTADPLPRLAAERARAAAPAGAAPDLTQRPAGRERPRARGCRCRCRAARSACGSRWPASARSTSPSPASPSRTSTPSRSCARPVATARSATRTGSAAPPTGAPPGSGRCTPPKGAERLHAVEADGRWTLDGIKPWCSLADHATHALVTAWLDDERRGLFAIDLSDDGVSAAEGESGQSAVWASRGLARGPQHLARLRVGAGGPGLRAAVVPRPPGLRLGRRRRRGDLVRRHRRRWRGPCATRQPGVRRTRSPCVHLGAVDTALARARAVLVSAAEVADDPETHPTRPSWWPSGPARSSPTPPTR